MAADAREAFERWYVGALVPCAREIERDGQGQYILMQTRLAWQAWHAGWLHREESTPPDAPPNACAELPEHEPDALDRIVAADFLKGAA